MSPVVGIWRKDRLTNNTTFDRFSTIAADGSGRLHVAWITQLLSGEYKLAYAFGNIESWRIEPLDGSFDPLLPFMSVTDDGRAHIVYRGGIAEHRAGSFSTTKKLTFLR